MSDFVSDFWNFYVSGIVILSILACLLLLIFTGRAHAVTAEDNTTGHVWDGDLREMNNPLPRWWSYLFVITVVFSFAYLALYPGLGSYPGLLGWTSSGLHAAEVKEGDEAIAPVYARFANMSYEDIAKDTKAMAIGERLYSNNCAQCHASDAQGNKGFPNLTDKDWLHGGVPENITQTIVEGRIGNMPPMAAAVGTEQDVKNVAQYVLSLSGSPHDADRAALGKEKFAVCAACHGEDGKGMQVLGSANLTDGIWLHGYGEKAIVDMVNNGMQNVMPPQGKLLTEPQIKVLTAYIWGLSNKS
ncbi:cytochrome-c oxidase, cbb3-type subunit III [Rhodoferax antarcticus]|uniref:Cbb3-type cytochrome c oxidase subunit n=1 Tax=Rhodoferax antarcticus ANT.BR TaxID=1111071 RepID=A0A1Q8YEY9_9BURK|nr:cytochrome-c oxidase, cbb3-type subunit III [Rhodoferax antarcticus]APW46270.1 cytochrome-c oxidase, cbb3-type subunit III [Rhodoferax antarcticus]OLP06479.1 cytochrome c oxidase, cbb3-type, subunit III [Rhodoferax antarcticus ANT.BR]